MRIVSGSLALGQAINSFFQHKAVAKCIKSNPDDFLRIAEGLTKEVEKLDPESKDDCDQNYNEIKTARLELKESGKLKSGTAGMLASDIKWTCKVIGKKDKSIAEKWFKQLASACAKAK